MGVVDRWGPGLVAVVLCACSAEAGQRTAQTHKAPVELAAHDLRPAAATPVTVRASDDRGASPAAAWKAPADDAETPSGGAAELEADGDAAAAASAAKSPVGASAPAPASEEKVKEEAEEDPEATATPGQDPRAIPPGTAPEAARAFRRIPVSLRDGPPIGGIGLSGIHVDRVALGLGYDPAHGCTGPSDAFSLAGVDRVNICFRVVHHRVEEDVTVVWERDGDLAQRRRGVTIAARHAYLTRAYLILRGEYAARWTVRILSEDGVELAARSFSVVP